ncbi:MAG: glycosyltransferase family 9 protein [Ignavibacteriaceae bacterium]|nr:glycosyltransferase family 9 protein [Ignavibacteriaceae bacterium]
MSEEKKILVIQTAFPGDAILTLPLIQELKKKKHEYLIDVLCIPSTVDIFAASPYVNSAIPFDKKGKQKSIVAFVRFIKQLRSNKYEIVYSPHRSLRSALIALNLSSKETIGFENSSLKFAFKKTVTYDPTAHEVRRNLEFIGDEYQEDKWRIIPEVKVAQESKQKVTRFLIENKIDKFMTIAPGSLWETKKYPIEFFKQIVEHFTNLKYKMILIGGAEDKLLCEALKKENVYITAGDFSFVETIELLRSASLLICNDSAPTHLGMCADIPVLTIYCSTVPRFGFYPYNKKSDYISFDDLICKPCGIHGFSKCPLDTFDCAKLLVPNLVIERAEKLLANAG